MDADSKILSWETEVASEAATHEKSFTRSSLWKTTFESGSNIGGMFTSLQDIDGGKE